MSNDKLTGRAEPYLRPGLLFEGKYRIIKMLGTGSFASVVHARHEIMGRDVALKFLKPEVVEKYPEVSDRFVKEVQFVSKLNSPSTVTIFDFGETADGTCYMVLEYVDGETLDSWIDRRGATRTGHSVEICLQILDSLGEAHAQGIVHRDLKPANIMIGKDSSVVKVLDFGVAKMLEESEQSRQTISGRQSTQFIGTPVYMSPEQILGQGIVASSDLYSLGLILYELLTGEVGVTGDTVAAVARQHLEDAPLPLPRLHTIVPPLRAILMRATARHPRDRYASAKEFRDDLEAFKSGQAGKSANDSGIFKPAASVVASATRGVSVPPIPAQQTMEKSGLLDVFSGKGYIGLPEDGEEDDFFSPTARPLPAPLPAPRSKAVVAADPARKKTPGARISTEPLTLDLEDVHRPQRERVRTVAADMTASGRPRADRFGDNALIFLGCVFAGSLALYAIFVLISCTMMEHAPWIRIAAGQLLPLVLATLGAGFATVTVEHLGFVRRWMVPVTRNLGAFLLTTVVLYALFGATAAAQGLQRNSTWFIEFLPEPMQLNALIVATQAVSLQAAKVFSWIGGLLPW